LCERGVEQKNLSVPVRWLINEQFREIITVQVRTEELASRVRSASGEGNASAR
jgi:hypothetical protein